MERHVLSRAQQALRQEIFARITEKLVFGRLSYEHQLEIAEKSLSREVEFLATRGHKLEMDKTVLSFLVRKGFHPKLGARPMRDATENSWATPWPGRSHKTKARRAASWLTPPMTASRLDELFSPLAWPEPRREFLNSRPLSGATSIVNEERKRRAMVFEPIRSIVDKRGGAISSERRFAPVSVSLVILRPKIIRDRDEIRPRIIRSLDEVWTVENRHESGQDWRVKTHFRQGTRYPVWSAASRRAVLVPSPSADALSLVESRVIAGCCGVNTPLRALVKRGSVSIRFIGGTFSFDGLRVASPKKAAMNTIHFMIASKQASVRNPNNKSQPMDIEGCDYKLLGALFISIIIQTSPHTAK